MRHAARDRYLSALARGRAMALRDGEDVGQENFMTGQEIRALAAAAGITADCDVLDLCCGAAGIGTFLARETGCRLLGVDYSESAIEVARSRGLPRCRFLVGGIPPVPIDEKFDVVWFVETMLAFDDKSALLADVARLLRPGGRLAMTFEEGVPLSADERREIPDGDGIFLAPLSEVLKLVEAAGLTVRACDDHTESHRGVAQRLSDAYRADGDAIAAELGADLRDQLVDGHRRWADWMASGRVRKFAVVAESGVICSSPRPAPRSRTRQEC